MFSSFLAFLAQYRIAIVTLLSVISPLFYGNWIQTKSPWPWLWLFAVTMLVLLLATLTPERYAQSKLVERLLPAIHRVFDMADTERVTVHILKSRRKERYEQLVDYHPRKYGGRGRSFPFSHGIVGECFKKMGAQWYSILDGETFEQAMARRWNFAPEELGRLRKDRRSFFAIAIGKSSDRAKAVVYLDSP